MTDARPEAITFRWRTACVAAVAASGFLAALDVALGNGAYGRVAALAVGFGAVMAATGAALMHLDRSGREVVFDHVLAQVVGVNAAAVALVASLDHVSLRDCALSVLGSLVSLALYRWISHATSRTVPLRR